MFSGLAAPVEGLIKRQRFLSERLSAAIPEKSIAVLAVRNSGDDKQNLSCGRPYRTDILTEISRGPSEVGAAECDAYKTGCARARDRSALGVATSGRQCEREKNRVRVTARLSMAGARTYGGA